MVKIENIYLIFSRCLILLITYFFVNNEFIKSSNAQLSPNVSLNLDVLEVLDPSIGVPRLLMPSPNNNGRIILRPPPGVTPINSNMRKVILRPPPGMPSKVSVAPKIDVPLPEKPANKPPIKVSSINTDTNSNDVEAVTDSAKKPGEVSKTKNDQTVSTPSTKKNTSEIISNKTSNNSKKIISESTDNNLEVASIPPSEAPTNKISVSFPNNSTDIPEEAKKDLKPLYEELNKFPSIKIKLLAYASDSNESSSSVRRRSLSRALSVRQFLIDNGIKNTRIEVRALGSKGEEDNSDRVDLVLNRQ